MYVIVNEANQSIVDLSMLDDIPQEYCKPYFNTVEEVAGALSWARAELLPPTQQDAYSAYRMQKMSI